MAAFLKQWKSFFTFAALLSSFVNLLQLTFPFYMFAIYSNIVVSYSEFSLSAITILAFFAVMILVGFSYLRSRLLALAGRQLSLGLRQDLYAGMVKGCVLDPGQAYQRGMADLESLRNYFSSSSVNALFDAPWAPFYLGLIYLFHPMLGLIATLGALVMVGLSALQELLVRKSMQEANRIHGQNQRFVDSFLRNVEVINGMGMIPAITDRFAAANNRVIANQTQSSHYAGAVQAMIKPLQNVIQVLIYCSGAYYAMTQGFNIGLMVAGSIIMGRGLAPLMQVMASWRFTVQAKESFLRLRGFSDFMDLQVTPMPLPEPRGALSVQGAVFRIKDQVLLKGVTFDLGVGEFLGIIGPSGAGKTTLCRLLLGIWPSLGGKVRLDGQDIFSWNKEEVGPFMGYLPQEIELFPGTVARNIARFGPVDEHALDKALEISGTREMVQSFPQGPDTLLEGEGGLKLSGGQRQKIGLARALYRDPRFLVLDEPTSNLDEKGEDQLLKALLAIQHTRACTCIMVTHKPSLLQSMDKVMVLRDGAVALFGPRDEVFAQLAGMQAPQEPMSSQAAL